MAYEAWNPPFDIGARVKVVGQRKYRSEKLVGLIGTVKTNYSNSIAVLLDETRNKRSSYGYFYFKPNELETVYEIDNEIVEEQNMKAVITNYLNVAKVNLVAGFNNNVYQCANFEPDLGVGNFCVVNTDDNVFVVAEVVEIVDRNDIEMRREIITKINTESYNKRVECRAKAAELKAKMEARAKQLQDIALYQMLAKDDPEMASILQEYQCLSKV